MLKAALHRAEACAGRYAAWTETMLTKLRARAVAWRARTLVADAGPLTGEEVYAIHGRAAAQRAAARISSGELLRFLGQLAEFNKACAAQGRAPALREDVLPCLFDHDAQVGFDAHYTYHTAWAARVLAESRPARHVDIGSHLMFVTICSAFVTMEHYDVRAVELTLDNLRTGIADLTRLPWNDDSISSLSCMHVVEHVGLGRYGDAIDPQGDRKAMRELARVLAPGGELLFVVPVGRARIQFNAHRVYDVDAVLRGFEGLELAEFSLIPSDGSGLVRNADARLVSSEEYACGCFRFRKPHG